MNRKNILMAVVAGGLFIAGLAIPDSWRSAAQDLFASLADAPVAVESTVESALESAADSAAVASTAELPAPESDQQQSDPPMPFDSVRQPLMLKKGDALGLGLGLFATEAGAREKMTQATQLGYTAQIVSVADKSGAVWYMPIAGKFKNDKEAQRVQAILAKSLAMERVPDILLIPPPPK